MKTVVIWETMIDPIKFFVLEGDYSRLDGIYANSARQDQGLRDELSRLTHDSNGNFLQNLTDKFPVEEVKNGALVIVAGFLP